MGLKSWQREKTKHTHRTEFALMRSVNVRRKAVRHEQHKSRCDWCTDGEHLLVEKGICCTCDVRDCFLFTLHSTTKTLLLSVVLFCSSLLRLFLLLAAAWSSLCCFLRGGHCVIVNPLSYCHRCYMLLHCWATQPLAAAAASTTDPWAAEVHSSCSLALGRSDNEARTTDDYEPAHRDVHRYTPNASSRNE